MCPLWIAVSLLPASACADVEEEPAEAAAPNPGAATDSDLCGGQGEPFEVPMALSGLTLIEATPTTPSQGPNRWTLLLPTNTPQTARVEVAPFMSAHGHGTSPPVFLAEPTSNPGELEVGPMQLYMPGLWSFTITITTDDEEPPSSMTLALCVDG